MVSHSGVPRRCGRKWPARPELERLGTLEGSGVDAASPMVFSWANWWALEAPAKPATNLSMGGPAVVADAPFFGRGATVDFCRPTNVLDRYEVVLVAQPLPSDGGGRRQARGRTWSGVRRWLLFWFGDRRSATPSTGAVRGPLRPLIGCERGGRAPLPRADDRGRMGGRGPGRGLSFWTDVATEGTGHVLARVPVARGREPAVVAARVGHGRAYYLPPGSMPPGCACVRPGPGLVGRARRPRAGPAWERVVRTSDDPRTSSS